MVDDKNWVDVYYVSIVLYFGLWWIIQQYIGDCDKEQLEWRGGRGSVRDW